jgi:hypothetical protein
MNTRMPLLLASISNGSRSIRDLMTYEMFA